MQATILDHTASALVETNNIIQHVLTIFLVETDSEKGPDRKLTNIVEYYKKYFNLYRASRNVAKLDGTLQNQLLSS